MKTEAFKDLINRSLKVLRSDNNFDALVDLVDEIFDHRLNAAIATLTGSKSRYEEVLMQLHFIVYENCYGENILRELLEEFPLELIRRAGLVLDGVEDYEEVRGELQAVVGNLDGDVEFQSACERALGVLESVFEYVNILEGFLNE